jgi:hypothetical protein
MSSRSLSIAFSRSPTLPQIQTAAEWLAAHSYPNPDLEIALHLVLQGRIISQEVGGKVAIIYTLSTTDAVSSSTVWGGVMVSSSSSNVSLVCGGHAITEYLFVLIQPHSCPIELPPLTKSKIGP